MDNEPTTNLDTYELRMRKESEDLTTGRILLVCGYCFNHRRVGCELEPGNDTHKLIYLKFSDNIMLFPSYSRQSLITTCHMGDVTSNIITSLRIQKRKAQLLRLKVDKQPPITYCLSIPINPVTSRERIPSISPKTS